MPAHVLVIEDNVDNLELMVYLLRGFGHTTATLEDGASAREVVQAQRPDVIICDIQLPTVDGLQVVRDLKTDPSICEIPVLAVTAYAMVGDRDRLLAAGFDGYIPKPIEPERFVDQVQEFLPPQKRALRSLGHPTHEDRPHSSPTRGTILAVDDLPANLQLIKSLFEPSGFLVSTCSTVAQALSLARKQRPNLLLCDVHLGGESGYDLIRRIKSDGTLRSIPCVVISSSTASPASDAEALSAGAQMFIVRPIDPVELLAKIQLLMDGAPNGGDS